ncbi:tRNA (guanosine(37)-N1)-methyltransferase TrmD [Mycoplasma sp. ATU-Cv-703]|uniref:tRNA (guanosine(37)-N1)-methyltransferase TrmD n=1 Tax=Mycoplasma sp. ATU-Cv-703 TaxID=2498595 RepID=UPI000FDD67D9
MRLNIVTLFPRFFEVFADESIVKRAIEKKLVTVNVVNLRDFSLDKHRRVDDQVYGGGQGMLLQVEPIDRALSALGGKKILLTPQGQVFNQKLARQLAGEKELTLVAGHYEGFDERVRSLVDWEISIGDFVLTGGEIPALALADAVIRLVPGVIKASSQDDDSFSKDLLEYPQYTRPRSYKGMEVPPVLLSGDHQKINQWRQEQALAKTRSKRPDLLRRKKHAS